jgi:hypothetical protein
MTRAAVILAAILAAAPAAAVERAAPASARLPWCGLYMMQLKHKTDRRLARAIEWAKEGIAAIGPAIGEIVIWPHHVGEIRGGPDDRGRWLVNSGNDGNAVRTRWRSLRGAVAYRWVQ